MGLLVGVTLNLVFKLLSYFGLINEKANVIDIIDECTNIFKEYKIIKIEPNIIDLEILKDYFKGENRTDYVLNLVYNIVAAEIVPKNNIKIFLLKEETGNIILKVVPYEEKYIELINDYPKNIKRQDNSLLITYDERFSIYKTKNVLRKI